MNLSLKNPLNESNIIIVIDSLDGGGAEAQAIKLASGLKKENIKIFQIHKKSIQYPNQSGFGRHLHLL